MDFEDDAAIEAWLEERAILFLAESSGGRRVSAEAFADELGETASNARLRERLIDRLRRVGELDRALASSALPDLAPGRELDDFVIDAQVGRGGMGQVFRARQKSLARVVAIKAPLWAAQLDERERARFRREAEAVANLKHPAIVALHQVGEHAGLPYLVMEFVEGPSLAERLRELHGGTRPREAASLGIEESSYERAAARLVQRVLEGLEAAHVEGIVHRDLKPANLVLAPDGRVRILDFGLARRAVEEPLTRTGELVGTPEYLAPELVRNPRAASPASDVYACGVLLYELLALERPFRESSTELLVARILEGDPAPLHTRRKAPRALSAIVEKALARDVTRRYASAAAFAADLERYLEGREVEARPSGPLARFGRQLQRRPAWVASAFALLAIVALASVWQRYGVVRAAANLREARRHFVSASLYELLDNQLSGAGPAARQGRDLAVDELRKALELEPAFHEARLHLAILQRELRNVEASQHEFSRLSAEQLGWRASGWLRHALEDPEIGFVGPEPSEEVEVEGSQPTDRFYAARAKQRRVASIDVAADIASSLIDDPLYGAAARSIEASCISTRGRTEFAYAAQLVEGALAVVPDHPVLVTNQVRNLCVEFDMHPGVVESAPRSLFDALPRCERAMPAAGFAIFWENYCKLLLELGNFDPNYLRKALLDVEPELQEFPDYRGLEINWYGAATLLILDDEAVDRDVLERALELVRTRTGEARDAERWLYEAFFLHALCQDELARERFDSVCEELEVRTLRGERDPRWFLFVELLESRLR